MSKLNLIDVLRENNDVSLYEQGARELVKGVVGDTKAFKAAKPGVFAAFEDVLRFAKQDKNQIVGLTAKSPNKAVVITNVDDLLFALKTEGGMSPIVLGKFNQGLLKSSKTPVELIDGITKEVVGTQNFIKRYSKLTDSQMRSELKAAGYSDNAIESFMKNAKKNPNFKKGFQQGVELRKTKSTVSGGKKELKPKGRKNVSQSVWKLMFEKSKDLVNGIKNQKWTWKKALAWAAGLGISAYALWWFLFEYDGPVPDDTPETEPNDYSSWAACLQELLKNKEAQIGKSNSGQISVLLKPDEYPGGLQFYPDGKVMDVANKKMGTWKCKGGQVSLKEQSSEIDVDTMTKYVDTAVDDLDGLVTVANLNSLKNIINSLKGKTFQGKDAMKEFLSLYSEDEGGDSFLSDIQSVGVRTLGTKGILAKRDLLSTLQGGGNSSSTVTSTNKIGLKNIEVNFGGEKPEGEKSGGEKSGGTKYKNCNDFPFNFGCKNPKIAQLQKCIGMESRYQTGNFGPLTRQALGGLSTITVELFNEKTQNCSPSVSTSSNISTKDLQYKAKGLPKADLSKFDYLNTSNDTAGTSPSAYYNSLKESGAIVGMEGGKRIKYKGLNLNTEQLSLLDSAMSSMGYTRLKQEDGKRYGSKYVWEKQ